MPDEVSVIVARCDIKGYLKMEQEAPPAIAAKEGDRLILKFPFKYEEISKEDDGFRLQLTSSLGDQEAEPATYTHLDRRGVADDKWGFISQEYDIGSAGEYTITWRAAAEHTDGEHRETDERSGEISLAVASAAPAPL